jgi:hypothetical protein
VTRIMSDRRRPGRRLSHGPGVWHRRLAALPAESLAPGTAAADAAAPSPAEAASRAAGPWRRRELHRKAAQSGPMGQRRAVTARRNTFFLRRRREKTIYDPILKPWNDLHLRPNLLLALCGIDEARACMKTKRACYMASKNSCRTSSSCYPCRLGKLFWFCNMISEAENDVSHGGVIVCTKILRQTW